MLDYHIPILPAYEGYAKNLEEGVRNGLIVHPGGRVSGALLGPFDKYSHLPDKSDDTTSARTGALRQSNTRPLHPSARKVIEYFIQQKRKFRYLEIGHGAGHSCFDVYQMAQIAGVEREIHSVGLTPVDPSYGLQMTIMEVVKTLPQTERKGDFETLIRNAAHLRDTDTSGYWRLRLDAALELQRAFGHQIFAVLDSPFIDRQYIGDFGEMELPEKSYDFIHEDRGFLYHGRGSFEKRLEKVLKLVSKNGVLMVQSMDATHDGFLTDSEGKEIVLENFIVLVWLDMNDEGDTHFFVHRESDIAKKLAPALTKMTRERGAYCVGDMGNFLEENLLSLTPTSNQ